MGPERATWQSKVALELLSELDDEVYSAIIEPERQQDPERKGIAVIVEVDSVAGAAANGFFQQTRG